MMPLMKSNSIFVVKICCTIFLRFRFWKKKSEHCPETRCEISRQHRKSNRLDAEQAKPPQQQQHQPRLFAECGRPYNLNQAKLQFQLIDEPDRYELDLHVYKYAALNLIKTSPG